MLAFVLASLTGLFPHDSEDVAMPDADQLVALVPVDDLHVDRDGAPREVALLLLHAPWPEGRTDDVPRMDGAEELDVVAGMERVDAGQRANCGGSVVLDEIEVSWRCHVPPVASSRPIIGIDVEGIPVTVGYRVVPDVVCGDIDAVGAAPIKCAEAGP